MAQKHPAPHTGDIPPDLPEVRAPRPCRAEEVEEAIRSFLPGSSGGLDGLTAQHLRDLLTAGGELRRALLRMLCRVCSIIARGDVPDEARNMLYGSWLVAATKSSGGLRPIAIGSTLRRLTAKILLQRIRGAAAAHLWPRQLGFSSRGGSEIAVHAVRRYLLENSRAVMVKVDFKNAFNSHRRDTMLREVHERFPEIYPMVSQTYRQPIPITFGDALIMSRTGCQQGDVFSPLLFCLVVHTTLLSLQSEITMGYLDDFTIVSPDPLKVIEDIRRIKESFGHHGLVIQPAKCEIYIQGLPRGERESAIESVTKSLPGCRVMVNAEDIELLGSPVFEARNPESAEEEIRGVQNHLSATVSRR